MTEDMEHTVGWLAVMVFVVALCGLSRSVWPLLGLFGLLAAIEIHKHRHGRGRR